MLENVVIRFVGAHDWRFVLLAGIVGVLASVVAVGLFDRARITRGRAGAFWLTLAGITTGFGIWASHFIAILGYTPNSPIAYEISLTVISLVIGIVVTVAGLWIASWEPRWAAPVGGAIIGLGIAAMHHIGVQALEAPGDINVNPAVASMSTVLSVALLAAAMTVAARRSGIVDGLAAIALFALSIMFDHFVSMGAIELTPGPATASSAAHPLLPATIAIAIAAIAAGILGMSLIGAIADKQLSTRTSEQNQRFDMAVNNMSQGFCMFDADFRLVDCNQAYLKIYGLPESTATSRCSIQDLIRQHFIAGTFEGDADRYVEAVTREIEAGEPTNKIIETKDGRVIAIANRPLPSGGRITTHEDITERHDLYRARAEVEVKLREQKVQLDAALNNQSQGVCMFDASARIAVINRSFLDMYRLSPQVVKTGCTLLELLRHRKEVGLLDADPERHAQYILDVMSQGRSSSWMQKNTDGRLIQVHNQPMPGGGWVTTHEDVTEQRNSEQQLREQKLQLDTALNHMKHGLLMFDADARIVICNQRYLQMYDLSPDVVEPGSRLQELLRVRKAKNTFLHDPDAYVVQLQKAAAEGRPTTAVRELPDGRVIAIANIPMTGGRWVSTHEDITEQRRAETLLRDQKLQLDTALNSMLQGLNMFDADGRLVLCNQRYLEMYGLSPEDARPGSSIQDLVQARIDAGTFFAIDANKYATDFLEAVKRREPMRTTLELADGRTIAIVSQPTPDGSNWVVTHEDITERLQAERERDRSQAFATTVIENVPVTIVVKDARDRRYRLVNQAGERYFGIPREKMIGKLAQEVFSPEIAETIVQHDRELIESGKPQFHDEHPVTTPGGERRIIAVTRLPIRDLKGETRYLLTLVDDRTHRKRAEAQIAHMAYHDALTGIPNRAAFTACIEATIDSARGANSSFALLSIDLDRFKEVNDVYGHVTGDELLRQLSHRLQSVIGGAFLARLGGDEFVVITTDDEQPAAAEALADQLQSAMTQEFTIHGHQLRAGVSIGVAIFPVNGIDATALVANADAALYRAKAEGRGTYRFFEAGMDKRLRDRRVLHQELTSAIERNELILHFQPQARISGEVTGFEALVRWQHPTRGFVPPGTFIPIAEESNLIRPLGEWILREACREAAQWREPLRIAINLSPAQFRHGDLAGLVHSVLIETGLAPDRLELEITEGVLIDDFSRAVAILRRLKALGVRIAMDDFGTGYSSLSYLQSFPFDKIKIDQTFISNFERSPQSATIIRAAIGLARGLQVPVVAEGVETKEQLAFLAKEACDEVQGYLIGRPAPIAEYIALTGRQAPVRAAAAG